MQQFTQVFNPEHQVVQKLRKSITAKSLTQAKQTATYITLEINASRDLETGTNKLESGLLPLRELFESVERALFEDGLQYQARNVLGNSADALVSRISTSTRKFLRTAKLYEAALDKKLEEGNSTVLKRYAGTGKVKARATSAVLKATTRYTMRVMGWGASYDMVMAALTSNRTQLSRDISDLEYVMEKIKKLEELPTTSETWRDVVETWCSLIGLISKISPERGIAVLECIVSDDELLKAVGEGRALETGIVGAPASLVSKINEKAGKKIRASAYGLLRALDKELVIIRRTKDHQERAVALLGAGIASAFISVGGLLARVYYDVLQTPGSRWVWLAPLVLVMSSVMCALCVVSTLFCLRRSSVENGLDRTARD